MKIRFGFSFLVVISLFLFSSSFVEGQAVRVWVSGLGDDTSPCSRTTPCKTLTGAISKVVDGGEINVIDSGHYGQVNITKSVTIDATGVFAGIRGTNGDSITINAGTGDVVVLRHLSINGNGGGRNAIKFNTGKALHLQNCLLQNFPGYGVDFESAKGGTLVIRDSIIINNGSAPTSNLPKARGSGGGVLIKAASGTAFATIDNTRVDGNYVGINARDNSKVTISRSVIARNVSNGLLTFTDSNAPAEMNVEHSVVTLNSVGIQAGGCSDVLAARGAETVRISGVNVTSNSANGLLSGCAAIRGGGSAAIISSKNNTILGNNPDGAPTSAFPQQ